ncbi:MAG: SLBB domain-containing protein [Phycisphaerales bacterium]|nr:MAG: SLBB domain-containing protein [Phycisphaerales bacterium]
MVLAVSLSLYFVGCSDQVDLPSTGQLLEFENAGPARPVVDMDRLVRARIGGGPYRVVPGDVLELTMPAILQIVTAEGSFGAEQATPYVCRVNDGGIISLPVVGDIAVSGRTLAQIEADVIDAYYPEYTVTRPSVFVQVLEYVTAKASITGAVQEPGIYSLRSDQMSLVALLMEAGGIIDDGAARISIVHQNEPPAGQEKSVQKALGRRGLPGPDASPAAWMDVRLSFKQMSSLSTTGEIAIRDPDDKILVREHLDVAREIERQALLERLAAREPRVSTHEVNERLCSLAEQLRPGSGYGRKGIETANTETYPNSAALMASAVSLGAEAGIGGANAGPNAVADEALYEQMSESGKEAYRILRGQNSPDSAPKAAISPSKEPESLVLPVKGFNIPFADVVLRDGDSVIVERLQPPLFTVMGLVNRPGNFPYPPDIRYNLAQALAFAGGLNEVADPRYATVYRLDASDEIVRAVFPIIDGSKLTDAANTSIKPGDIVAVEQTPRTRTAVFLNRIFRINIGTYLRLEDTWD